MATSDVLAQLNGISSGKRHGFGREFFGAARRVWIKFQQGFRSDPAQSCELNDLSLKDRGETEFEAPEAFNGRQSVHPWHAPANCSPQILLVVGPR
jgi:hypothetical protein